MKYSLSISGVVIILLFALPHFISLEHYKNMIISEVKKQTGQDLIIDGKIQFSILPRPKVKLSKLKLSSIAEAKDKNLIEIEKIEAKLAILPLFMGKIAISKLELEKPAINLEKFKNGQNNWDFGIPQTHEQEPRPVNTSVTKVSQNKNPLASLPFMIHKIEIIDGKLQYIDKGEISKIDNFNIDFLIANVNGPIDFSLRMVGMGQNLSMNGKIKEIKDQIPVNINIIALKEKINIDGIIDITTQSFAGKMDANGDLKNFNSTLFPKDLKTTYNITSQVSFDKEKGVLDNIQFVMDNISGKGKAYYNFLNSENNIALKLNPGAIEFSLSSNPSTTEGINGTIHLVATNLDSFIKALKLTHKLPITINSNLTFNSNISYKDENFLFQNMMLNLGAFNISGMGGIKNWSDNLTGNYDLNITDANSLFNMLGYKLPVSLSKMQIKGETVCEKKNYVTNTLISTAGANIVLNGNINTSSGTKSLINITAKGNNLNLSLHQLFKQQNSLSLGAFNVTAHAEGDATSNGLINIEIGKNTKSTLVLGGETVDISSKLGLNLSKSKPDFTFDLNLSAINLSKITNSTNVPTSSKVGVSNSHTRQNSEAPWSRNKIDLAGLNEANGIIHFHLQKLVNNSLIFENIAMEAELNDGILKINSIAGDLYGGKLNGAATISGQKNQPVSFNTSLKGANLRNIAPEGKKIKVTSGIVDFTFKLESHGNSQYEYVTNLFGNINLDGKDGKISGMNLQNIAHSLDKIKDISHLMQNLDNGFNNGETQFNNMRSEMQIDKGIINLTKCELASNEISANALGQFNLPTFTLDINTTINTGVKNLPPFKVHFNGSINSPQHKFDIQALRQHYIEHTVSDVVNNLINGKKKQTTEGNNTPAQNHDDSKQQSPKDAVNDLLKKGMKSLFKQ